MDKKLWNVKSKMETPWTQKSTFNLLLHHHVVDMVVLIEFGYENWIWCFGIINSEKDGKPSKFIWTLGSFIWKINEYHQHIQLVQNVKSCKLYVYENSFHIET